MEHFDDWLNTFEEDLLTIDQLKSCFGDDIETLLVHEHLSKKEVEPHIDQMLEQIDMLSDDYYQPAGNEQGSPKTVSKVYMKLLSLLFCQSNNKVNKFIRLLIHNEN